MQHYHHYLLQPLNHKPMHYRAPEALLRQIHPPLQQQYRSTPSDRSIIESTIVLLGRAKILIRSRTKTHLLVFLCCLSHSTTAFLDPLLMVR